MVKRYIQLLALIDLPRRGMVTSADTFLMMASLEKHGQSNPINVEFATATGFYRILDGNKRAEAMTQLRWEWVWIEE